MAGRAGNICGRELLKSLGLRQMSEQQELRVVLLGKTGAGKSSLGNTLLGREAFLVECSFSSVTFRCQWAQALRYGTLLQVTDTPGVSDTNRNEDEVLKEVGKSIAVASPGPHVVLMVLRCDRRFTTEEYNAYGTLKRLFGPDICDHMIVVFAGADGLGKTQDERDSTLARAIQTAPGQLKEVMREAGERYCSVDNTASRDQLDRQAQTILTTIQELVSQNGGRYFTSTLCEEVNEKVETVVHQRMETQGLPTHEVALRDTRQAIVDDRAGPGFFGDLMQVVKTSLLPVVGEFVQGAARIGVGIVLGKCSLM